MSSGITSKELQINFKMREVSQNRMYEFGGFRLDAGHLLLYREGERVNLTPKVVETLLVLIERSGEVVSKDELMSALWPETTVEESNLSQNLYVLRKALGTNTEGKPFIETLRRRGYRFCGDVVSSHTPSAKGREQLRPIKVDRVDNIYSVSDWNRERAAAVSPATSKWPSALAALFLMTVIVAGGFVIYRASANVEPPKEREQFQVRVVERLTTSGRAKRGAISPDGRYLLYITEDANGAGSVWLRQVASSADVLVAGPLATEIVWADFSPEGDNIYYVALERDKGDMGLYRVPTLGGPSVLAIYDGGPVGFSPDGSSVAFVRIYNHESRLLISARDGSNERPLAVKREPESFNLYWNAPAWSPDGKSIAYPTRLVDGRGVYETIVTVNVDDGTEKILTGNRWNRVGQARWAGDSVFITAAETAVAPAQIWQISVGDGIATRITQDLNDYSGLNLTADGSQLSAVQEQRLSGIAVGDKQIVGEVGYIDELDWTSQGRIAYVSATGDIWTINADGSNARQVTAGAHALWGFGVSPDGGRVVFSSDRSGKPNLWLAKADGSGMTQITFGERDTYPQFTADGRSIVFQRGESEPFLWRISADGGEPVKFSENAAARPAVSADGNFVAYKYLDGRFERSRWSIGVMASDGGPQLMRFDFPPTSLERYVRFAPDSRSVAFPNTVNGASEIWLQPLTGAPPKRLTKFDSLNVHAFDWSPDGKTLAAISNTVTRDVVLLKR